ncbi:MAG: transposase [Methanosarcinales archaeon]|nr:transposase [Methanosarcinales archaeon]
MKNLPEIMFRSAIVQFLMNYSDRQMEDAARYNLIIKWFIGISLEDSFLDCTPKSGHVVKKHS